MFHNTLVVGSSPTSSTTQSPTTGESGLVKNALFFIGARRRWRASYTGCFRDVQAERDQRLTDHIRRIVSQGVVFKSSRWRMSEPEVPSEGYLCRRCLAHRPKVDARNAVERLLCNFEQRRVSSGNTHSDIVMQNVYATPALVRRHHNPRRA